MISPCLVGCSSPQTRSDLLEASNAKQAVVFEPEDTEDWSVQPAQLSFNDNKVPSDAVVLFDGSSLEAWRGDDGSKAPWSVENSIARIVPGRGGITTKETFCDIQLHIEFRSPLQGMNGNGTGQIWGNSGVFLQSRYEVQVLNSFENETYANGQAASVYKQYPPLVNASLPPGEWQTYDIIFSSPRFEEDGSLSKPAYVTVLHNGTLVQNNVEIFGPTRYIGLPEYEPHDCAPLHLQDHGEAIEFRNIWVRKL